VKQALARGFHFASLLTDVRILVSALARSLAEVRDTTAEVVKGY
jgi:hypothetical protein